MATVAYSLGPAHTAGWPLDHGQTNQMHCGQSKQHLEPVSQGSIMKFVRVSCLKAYMMIAIGMVLADRVC